MFNYGHVGRVFLPFSNLLVTFVMETLLAVFVSGYGYPLCGILCVPVTENLLCLLAGCLCVGQGHKSVLHCPISLLFVL